MQDSTATAASIKLHPIEPALLIDPHFRIETLPADPLDQPHQLAPARGMVLGAAAGVLFWVALAVVGHAAGILWAA